MTYEYMTGMGGIVTYPGHRGGDYSPDTAECSSLQCPPGSMRQSAPGSTYWATSPQSGEEREQRTQELRRNREQQRALTDRGCVRLCTARSGDVRAGEVSTATEHYCCPPEPDADSRYLEDYIRRSTFKAPYPEGAACHWDAGYGGRGQAVPQFDGTTRAWQDYSCDPTSGMSCPANLQAPSGCVSTGRWYSTTSKELCCRSDDSPPVPTISLQQAEAAAAETQSQLPCGPVQPPAETAQQQQPAQTERTFDLTHLLIAGVAGIVLYALLKR